MKNTYNKLAMMLLVLLVISVSLSETRSGRRSGSSGGFSIGLGLGNLLNLLSSSSDSSEEYPQHSHTSSVHSEERKSYPKLIKKPGYYCATVDLDQNDPKLIMYKMRTTSYSLWNRMDIGGGYDLDNDSSNNSPFGNEPNPIPMCTSETLPPNGTYYPKIHGISPEALYCVQSPKRLSLDEWNTITSKLDESSATEVNSETESDIGKVFGTMLRSFSNDVARSMQSSKKANSDDNTKTEASERTGVLVCMPVSKENES